MKSTRTFLAVLFLLTTVAAGVFAYREYLELVALRAHLSDPKTGLEKELADARKRIRELQDQLVASRTAQRKSGGDAASTDGPRGADTAGGNRGNRRSAMMAIFNSPQFQSLRDAAERPMLDSRYADLFKNLVQQFNLTPQQIDQFKNLLVQRQQALQDARQIAAQQGINPRTDPTGFAAAQQEATADVDTQIKSTIGDAGFTAYQQYDQTAPQRTTINQLQQSLSYLSAPLSDAQSQQLTALLQPTSASNAGGGGQGWGGGGPGGPGGMGGGATISTQALTAAASFLNATQLQALQQLQQAQQAQQQMQQLLRQQFRNQGGGATGRGNGG